MGEVVILRGAVRSNDPKAEPDDPLAAWAEDLYAGTNRPRPSKAPARPEPFVLSIRDILLTAICMVPVLAICAAGIIGMAVMLGAY